MPKIEQEDKGVSPSYRDLFLGQQCPLSKIREESPVAEMVTEVLIDLGRLRGDKFIKDNGEADIMVSLSPKSES